MSDEMKNADVSPTVALFQKAHANLVQLQRLDDQIAQLAEKRRKIQTDLREAQAMLNDEIDRAATPADEASLKIASANARRRAAGPMAEAA
jgi:predicted  nucleic acid-binding Zn-ribbon protein